MTTAFADMVTDDRDEWQLPAFVADAFGPQRHDYCVVIPVINEGDRLVNQLSGMGRAGLGVDTIVADGGSDDGSTEPGRLKQLGVRCLLEKTGPGRLSAQLRMGFAYALRQGYRGIVTIDGNGKDGYEAIPDFVAALRDGYDFVQGSRYRPGGVAVNTPRDRELALKYLHAPLLSLAAGFHYTDTTNGFRAYSASFLTDWRVRPFRDVFDSYNLHYYLAARAPRLGFRVCELPVKRAYPAAGPTPTKIGGLAGKLHILKLLGLTVVGAYNPRGR